MIIKKWHPVYIILRNIFEYQHYKFELYMKIKMQQNIMKVLNTRANEIYFILCASFFVEFQHIHNS